MDGDRYCYRLDLGYLGTRYHGWQRQPDAQTVQGVLEAVLSRILRVPVETVGAGRTDTGVHARCYTAHMVLDAPIEDIGRVQLSLNRLLPTDIGVYRIVPVEGDFHARFSAVAREYCYTITRRFDPFLSDRAWVYRGPLDAGELEWAAGELLGQRDFAVFCKRGSAPAHTLCELYRSEWVFCGDRWEYWVRGNRFLRGMVRALVGTQVELARGLYGRERFLSILSSSDRCSAGESAPAGGLVFERAYYEEDE